MSALARTAIAAAFHRELAATRANRFLYAHIGLATVAGFLPLLTPDDVVRSAPLWALHAVLYCLSLSAVLLGLSSAHGEADELPLLFAQPAPRAAWLTGKAAALALVLLPASVMLVAPVVVLTASVVTFAMLAAAASGVTLALAIVGLGVGCWIRDPVRALLTSLAVWFVLLFGTDLLLLAVAGAPWVPNHPGLWAALLMINPLDALRIGVMFDLEQAAFAGLDAGVLVGWWLAHGWTWLALVVLAWTAGGLCTALAGASRRLDA
jgi:hypothetical protein